MDYFSGFLFSNESELFNKYLIKNDFSVAGFSYGAIKAFEFTLKSRDRIDLLQLFSPANFENQDRKFKKLQLISYRRDREKYIDNFFKNVAFDKKRDLSKYRANSSIEELKELLYYKWEREKLENLIKRGVKIEVYLGEYDKIVDSNFNYTLFKEYATIYYIKRVGHILI